MAKVVCWCCDYYMPTNDDCTEGACSKTFSIKCANDTVCEEFLIRRGLHTKRDIPAYCKNYSKR